MAKTPQSYKLVQFNLPVALAADLKEIAGQLQAEARRDGERLPTRSEIAANGLRKELRRRRRALEKRQERAEAQ